MIYIGSAVYDKNRNINTLTKLNFYIACFSSLEITKKKNLKVLQLIFHVFFSSWFFVIQFVYFYYLLFDSTNC